MRAVWGPRRPGVSATTASESRMRRLARGNSKEQGLMICDLLRARAASAGKALKKFSRFVVVADGHVQGEAGLAQGF